MQNWKMPGMRAGLFFLFALLLVPCSTGAEQFKKKVEKPIDESISIRQEAQKEFEKWADEKSALETEFENLTQTRERLAAEVERLTRETDAKEEKIAAIDRQIRSMEIISEDFAPFLENAYAKLAEQIEEPPPFLMEERTLRLHGLKETLDDSRVAMGEKFRKVMEALFIEAEYGNTVETYQEKIGIGREEVLATVFRLGTMALFYETLDRKGVGYYDLSENKWTPLPAEANREIREAIEIASKMRPAEIVSLPLGRIVVK